MNSKYAPVVVLTVLGMVVVLALGWLLLISPVRGDVSDLHAKRDEVDQNALLVRTQTAKLVKYADDAAADSDAPAELALNVPSTVDVAAQRARIMTAARGAGVEIASMGLEPSFAVGGWELPRTNLDSTAIAKLFQTGPVQGTLPAGQAYVPAVSASTETGPLVTSLYGVTVDMRVVGTYAELQKFIASLQDPTQQLFLLHDLEFTARNATGEKIEGVSDPADGGVILSVKGDLFYLSPDLTFNDDGVIEPTPASGSPFVVGDPAKPQPGAP